MSYIIFSDHKTSVIRSDFFFFFQAEDGIRDLTVTGVQTCALPISISFSHWSEAITFFTCRTLSAGLEEDINSQWAPNSVAFSPTTIPKPLFVPAWRLSAAISPACRAG